MDRRESSEPTLRVLAEFAEAVADADEAEAAFRAADATAKALIGHRLFTVMAFHAQTMEVERCYSSDPVSYPAGGRKQKRDTAWGSWVLEGGQPYLGRTADDIRRHFNDHAVILALGLGGVLNVPVKALGQTIGTMNLLDEAGHYHEHHVGIARVIALGLVGALHRRGLAPNTYANPPRTD